MVFALATIGYIEGHAYFQYTEVILDSSYPWSLSATY